MVVSDSNGNALTQINCDVQGDFGGFVQTFQGLSTRAMRKSRSSKVHVTTLFGLDVFGQLWEYSPKEEKRKGGKKTIVKFACWTRVTTKALIACKNVSEKKQWLAIRRKETRKAHKARMAILERAIKGED